MKVHLKSSLEHEGEVLIRQKEQIRKRKEALELRAELQAASAKISVFSKSMETQMKTSDDGMTEYFEEAGTRSFSTSPTFLHPAVTPRAPLHGLQSAHSGVHSQPGTQPAGAQTQPGNGNATQGETSMHTQPSSNLPNLSFSVQAQQLVVLS